MISKKHKQQIIEILEKHGINRAGIFGSVAKGTQTESSDIDILIDLQKDISLLEFVKIKLELEYKLNMQVDLLEYRAIKPQLRKKILSEEIRIYG